MLPVDEQGTYIGVIPAVTSTNSRLTRSVHRYPARERTTAYLTLALLSLWHPHGQAQIAPPSVKTSLEATTTIRGRVLASGTNVPIRTARVQVSQHGGVSKTVFTDRDGRFAIRGLRIGAYELTCTKTGFVRASLHTSTREAAGASGDEEEIRLTRAAVISGHVLDPSGDPVVGTPVTAQMRSTHVPPRGDPLIATTRTNDTGEYRISGLPSGDALIAVGVAGDAAGSGGNEPSRGGISYVMEGNRIVRFSSGAAIAPRTYYPGVSTVDAAQPVPLGEGDDRAGVDIVIRTQPAVATLQPGGPSDSNSATNPTSEVAGTISGTITREDGRPLPYAVVRLLPGSQSTITDEHGQYQFGRIPAGLYTLVASRADLLTTTYGQRHTGDLGQSIRIGLGALSHTVNVSLQSPAVISGLVIDEEGQPIEGASVRAFRLRYGAGRRHLVAVLDNGTRLTDDLGRYRIYGLEPGTYVVRALVGPIVGQDGPLDLPGYAPTYFPRTINGNEATPLIVGTGQQLNGVDIQLVRADTANVRGLVLDAGGTPAQAGLSLTPSRRSGAISAESFGARVNEDGTFEFPNVPSGDYVLQAWQPRVNSSSEGQFASQLITVGGVEVAGVVIRMSSGSTINGRITVDDSSQLIPNQIELSALPVDWEQSALVGNPPARAAIHAGGHFEMHGLNGPRRLTMARAPEHWMLKAVRVHGRDVTDVALSFGSVAESLDDIEVVVSRHGGQLSGEVFDERGRVAPDLGIVAFATDRELWFDGSRFVKRVNSGPTGLFSIDGLPTGEYFVSAFDETQPGEWQDPSVLESLTTVAIKIVVTEGQQSFARLRVSLRQD